MTAAILWLLLRFDPTIVPAYVATGVVLTMLFRAIQVGTPLAYLTGAAAIAATVVMAWLVTRYIEAPLPPAPAPAGVAGGTPTLAASLDNSAAALPPEGE